jgi:hypothetical protein
VQYLIGFIVGVVFMVVVVGIIADVIGKGIATLWDPD